MRRWAQWIAALSQDYRFELLSCEANGGNDVI